MNVELPLLHVGRQIRANIKTNKFRLRTSLDSFQLSVHINKSNFRYFHNFRAVHNTPTVLADGEGKDIEFLDVFLILK